MPPQGRLYDSRTLGHVLPCASQPLRIIGLRYTSVAGGLCARPTTTHRRPFNQAGNSSETDLVRGRQLEDSWISPVLSCRRDGDRGSRPCDRTRRSCSPKSLASSRRDFKPRRRRIEVSGSDDHARVGRSLLDEPGGEADERISERFRLPPVPAPLTAVILLPVLVLLALGGLGSLTRRKQSLLSFLRIRRITMCGLRRLGPRAARRCQARTVCISLKVSTRRGSCTDGAMVHDAEPHGVEFEGWFGIWRKEWNGRPYPKATGSN